MTYSRKAVLTECNVRDILIGWDGGRTGPELAAEFGVSEGTITNIVRRETWKHVLPEFVFWRTYHKHSQ